MMMMMMMILMMIIVRPGVPHVAVSVAGRGLPEDAEPPGVALQVSCQAVTAAIIPPCDNSRAVPALFVFISFIVWLSDILTDAVIIQILWDFKLPIM